MTVMIARRPFHIALALLLLGCGTRPVWADLAASVSAAPDQALSTDDQRRAAAHAHYLAARALEEDGKMRAALDHYIPFLQAGADDPDLVAHIAELSLNYRDLDRTIVLLEQVIQAHPARSGPVLNLVLFALTHAEEKKGLMEKAVAVSTDALARFPHDAAVYETAVRVQMLQKAHDKAAEILTRATQQNVADPAFWLQLGRTAQEVWPLAEAEKRPLHLSKINPYYDKALTRAQAAKNSEAVLETADFFLFSNQLDRAVAICEALLKQESNLDAHKRLVRLYEAMDRHADSLRSLEELVRKYPADVEHRRLLAREYIQKQDVPKAVEQLQAALQAGGGDLNDYLQISHLLRIAGPPEKLDQFTIRAQRLYPGEPRISFYRALALNDLKKYGDAASLFAEIAEQSETMAPELLDDRFHFSWGVSLERSGNFDEAAKRFDKSIQLTPPDDLGRAANTMNYLGYMWLERGQHFDKAEELIRKANELEKNNPAFIDSLGWLFLKQGKPAEALTELLKAESLMEEITKEDAEILDHIAQTYDRLGQTDKAREYWQRTLDLKPEVQAIRDRAAKALGKDKPSVPKTEKE